jgi:uncharacterized protein YxeA
MKKTILIVISVIGLLLTLLPAFFYFYNEITLDQQKNLMLTGTILWLSSAPFWLGKKKKL